ncbi:hypothetical protein [Arvimicrobium flavum]|uniref:hypothetical protein n=1 Tax=Arvimicrobium flavum TaxID=3393320 RepID=UPI00237B2502|nr:hypothetical protein [Mesorhizobium shangrilense]
MKRILVALPLAGMMFAAPGAFAQSAPPTATGEAPPQLGEQAKQDRLQPKRGDCVDLTDGAAAGAQQQTGDNADAAADTGNETDKATAAIGGAAEEVARAPAQSETQPVAGPDAGTAPGGSGSSAWTGGLGGSDIGTSQAKELDSSPKKDHPPVASGLDPISGETAAEGPQAPATLDGDAAMTPTAPATESSKETPC